MKSCTPLAALIVVLLTCNGANAGFDDGNALLETCRDQNTGTNRFICIGAVPGYYDAFLIAGMSCPGENRYTRGQIRDIVLKYITDHPAKRHMPAALLAFQAFEAELSCKMQ